VKYCALLKLYRDSHHASTKLARQVGIVERSKNQSPRAAASGSAAR
jgi:hypothetical protein